MPIIYRIDHEKRIIIARAYGRLSDGDVFNYQNDAWSREDVVGYDELVDFTHVSEIEMPSAQRIQTLASIAARKDKASVPSRFAIVAPGDLAFGLGRMFQAYREFESGSTKDVRVFRVIDDALTYLNIDQSTPLPPVPPDTATEKL